ncbi:hypothetical protein PtA15_13A239 [Puccinia triticina]|uniref:Uncharacterized protein n=1 Tax=Puccinia triticina TaxID=208348 RepID=A0ABY7D1S1_9BASI|nr:uncharacterized protein PtA15_13A239 [Puccinia triticina]WAQ90840.1 hypothetical protein PtA15_13A239 [Puccinia triticina]
MIDNDPKDFPAPARPHQILSCRPRDCHRGYLQPDPAGLSKVPTFHWPGYPHSLLAIYPPAQTSTSNASHYPNNLKNLYGNMAVSESPEGESGVHSLPMVAQDSAMGSKAATVADPAAEEKPMVPCPSSIGHSKHNPRSPSFNVEHALADAMSEQSIGSLATLEFVRSHSSTELSRSDTSGRRQTQIGCKDLYRGRGRKGNMVRYI